MVSKLVSYILYAVCSILLGIAILLYFQNKSLKNENNKLLAELSSAKAAISIQSAQIEKNKIDLENYKNNQDEIKTVIKTRYETIKIEDSSCKAELNSIRNLLKAYSINR